MIRTHIVKCQLDRATADNLNRASGYIYSHIVSTHWKLIKRKGLWLSERSMTRISDLRLATRKLPLHAHSIDAAQQGFYRACATVSSLRQAGVDAKFPYRNKRWRTTVWKNTAIKLANGIIRLSNGRNGEPIEIKLPDHLGDILRVVEVRLVMDGKARCYTWHVVVENGKQPKQPAGDNTVSVDLGEVHPAVVGDERETTIITCRERRHQQQGHAKRMAKLSRALARNRKGSRRYKRLVRARARMRAKHKRVMRDIEHKVSRAIVDAAVERKASTIVIGDIRDAADEVNLGKQTNQKLSSWNHGQTRSFVEYKAEAEGITVVLQDEYHTTQTCPACSFRHKPRGRLFRCPACGFQSHRDVVGQINILSAFKFGAPGKIAAPILIKHRMPHNLRLMGRCQDTGQSSRGL